MSVQYKSEDGWKNISSSSNNAVDTVADGNMNPVTSNAVWEQSRYENAVRLNFHAEGTAGAVDGISIPSINDTADKQIQYMLNYVKDISIAKDKPLVYCGICVLVNASNTTSVACPNVYTFQIATIKGATSYWARGQFITQVSSYSNAIALVTQVGDFEIRRQCERSVNHSHVANNVTITTAAPTSTYTADRDGEVYVHIDNSTGGYTPTLEVNGVEVDSCPFHRPGSCTLRARVSKGDTYQVTTDNPSGDSRMHINAMGIQGISHWTDRATSW